MIVVIGLFEGCLMHLCIVYTLRLVAFVFSIAFSHADIVGGLHVTSICRICLCSCWYICISSSLQLLV